MINPILLHALDILSAVLTVISLYYVKKYNWMWIVYLLASMIFFALMLYNGGVHSDVAVKEHAVGHRRVVIEAGMVHFLHRVWEEALAAAGGAVPLNA